MEVESKRSSSRASPVPVENAQGMEYRLVVLHDGVQVQLLDPAALLDTELATLLYPADAS